MPVSLERLLRPRSIAVVGASDRPGSFGERLVVEALRSTGVDRVHLIHPTRNRVHDRDCVPSLDDLDEAPDLVLFGIPDRALPDEVRRAAELGAGGGVCFGSAYGLGEALRGAAASGAVPLPLVGAGCMGFVNPTHGVRAIGYLERTTLPAGPIALVTHSGSVFSALLRTHRRLEYSLAVSSGQELVTASGDYLHWALDQPETRVIGLFLEASRGPESLRSALARAAAADIPVVALT
ncbi:MAG: CoA-binding protein, partial [Nocardioides sp.]